MNDLDDESRRTLHILDEVAKNHRISQRALSERLGVALGCTNLYLKRLVKKGFIKLKGIPGRRYFYYLTPAGFAEKTSLAFRYLKGSWRYYEEIREQWRVCFQQLKKEGVERVVLFGVGEMAELAYLSLKECNLHMVGIIDSQCAGSNFCGHKVNPVLALLNINYDRVVLTTIETSPGILNSDFSLLSKHGVPKKMVVGLFSR